MDNLAAFGTSLKAMPLISGMVPADEALQDAVLIVRHGEGEEFLSSET